MKKQKLIDADHLIESIKDGFTENSDYRHMFQLFVDFVDEEPTIDPVKHAHWIRVARSRSEYWQCSNCYGYFTLPMPKYRGFYMRYCGCCGAKMDEVTE